MYFETCDLMLVSSTGGWIQRVRWSQGGVAVRKQFQYVGDLDHKVEPHCTQRTHTRTHRTSSGGSVRVGAQLWRAACVLRLRRSNRLGYTKPETVAGS